MPKRDIVTLALNHKPVPYTPWSFSFTKEAEAKLQEHYDDINLHNAVGNHIVSVGNAIGFFEDIGDERYRDVFGAIWDRSIDKDIGNIESCLLSKPTLDGYTFPNPLDPRFFADIPATLDEHEDCFRLFCLGFSLYERAWTLRGMENLLLDFFDNPGFVHELFAAITDYNLAQVEKAMEYDIDAVYFGDDWGEQHGLIMGHELWLEFIQPQWKLHSLPCPLRRRRRFSGEHARVHRRSPASDRLMNIPRAAVSGLWQVAPASVYPATDLIGQQAQPFTCHVQMVVGDRSASHPGSKHLVSLCLE